MSKRMRRAVAVLGLFISAGAASFLVARPAEAVVRADCSVGLYGKNLDGVAISCAVVTGGEARGRADCAYAPDVYTNWVTSWQSSASGFCLFSARGAILNVRER